MTRMEKIQEIAPMADLETASENYAGRFSGPVGAWFLDIQAAIALDMLNTYPRASILDVGGGHGQLAVPLSRQGYEVTVLGSHPDCCRRIQQDVEAGKMKYATANLLELPFAENSVEVAICFRLLPHCAEWRRVIDELCRVASNAVIVDYPTGQSMNCLTDMLFGAKKKIEKNTRPYTLFRHRDIMEAFEKNNYRVARRVPQFFLPMVLHRALKHRSLSSIMEKGCAALGLTRLWGSPVILKALCGEIRGSEVGGRSLSSL
ncbi:MAG: class I SAM-dependent methyltransferase [Spartobacteria bacterium]|nr:class I SAM-dependent methyltransferase [Spartobacteria bacterium]